MRIVAWFARSGILAGLLSTLLPALAQEQKEEGRAALVLQVEGAIGPAIADYVVRGLAEAREREAALVILRMDTPGGLDSAMRTMIRDILASPVPVATYVAPNGARAASAGTYIMYASHVAAMAPSTNLGAATPVAIGGGGLFPEPEEDGDGGQGKEGEKPRQPPRDTMATKAINDAVAYIRGLAALHGRNADWAEQAVREAVSLTASAALAENVIDLVAADIPELLDKAHGREINLRGVRQRLDTKDLRVEALDPDWRTRLLATITDPNVAYILMLIGIYGIIFELANPGAVFPGVVGGICLLVALFALNLLPISYAGVGLVLLGIALMTAEVFLPSFGILGIGGAVAFVMGSLMMFGDDVPGFSLSPAVVVAAAAVSGALFLLVLAMLVRSRRRSVVSGAEELLGLKATVLEWRGARGQVRVHGERWEAQAEAMLAPGQRVRVTGRDGLVLLVEAEEAGEGGAT